MVLERPVLGDRDLTSTGDPGKIFLEDLFYFLENNRVGDNSGALTGDLPTWKSSFCFPILKYIPFQSYQTVRSNQHEYLRTTVSVPQKYFNLATQRLIMAHSLSTQLLRQENLLLEVSLGYIMKYVYLTKNSKPETKKAVMINHIVWIWDLRAHTSGHVDECFSR